MFEEHNHLLFYPVQYEGEEQSKNVFYTAAPPNQQLVPAAEYMMDEGYKKFYLLGLHRDPDQPQRQRGDAEATFNSTTKRAASTSTCGATIQSSACCSEPSKGLQERFTHRY